MIITFVRVVGRVVPAFEARAAIAWISVLVLVLPPRLLYMNAGAGRLTFLLCLINRNRRRQS